MESHAILIVDDAAENRLLLQAYLKAAGYRDLRMAESAREAFTQLALDDPAPVNEPPGRSGMDLILLDIMMPEVDGIEACRRIKAVERLADIPIIMVTALTETKYLQQAFAAGAMDYITKPIKKMELLPRVESALRLKHELDRRKAREQELEQALREVKVLRGFIPICASCKNIRNDQGYWQRIENYIQEHSEARFSHGICGACVKRLYPDLYELDPALYKDRPGGGPS